MKFIFYTGFLAIFGTYGLGLAGVLDDPEGLAEFKMKNIQVAELKKAASTDKGTGHYTLKAMR